MKIKCYLCGLKEKQGRKRRQKRVEKKTKEGRKEDKRWGHGDRRQKTIGDKSKQL
jgi:hypothetical protein